MRVLVRDNTQMLSFRARMKDAHKVMQCCSVSCIEKFILNGVYNYVKICSCVV